MAVNYKGKSFMEQAPGLMVMGGDSCSEGSDSQHCILDGHFSHILVVKIVMST